MILRRRGHALPRVMLVLVILFIGIQVMRPNRTNPLVVSDMIDELAPPPEVAAALRRGCYDCHSHETRWPWYSAITPLSWYLAHHIEEAREHLNFSQWADYNDPAALHKLEEALEEVEAGEMPLSSYLLLHPAGRWTDDELEAFEAWVETLKTKENSER